tara:strand:- start:4565 stop:4879 length:315 start_codon:yes stop_codon:yes gene_type:complete
MKFNLSISQNLKDLITKLNMGLGKITFEDNMESFKVENIEIRSGKTVTIRNELTFIPTKYIIVSQEGHGVVTRSKLDGVDWNINNVFLINHGPNDVTVTVIFMR